MFVTILTSHVRHYFDIFRSINKKCSQANLDFVAISTSRVHHSFDFFGSINKKKEVHKPIWPLIENFHKK